MTPVQLFIDQFFIDDEIVQIPLKIGVEIKILFFFVHILGFFATFIWNSGHISNNTVTLSKLR